MSTKEQFQLTLDKNQKDQLCDLLYTDLSSWFEFYEHEPEELAQLENYACFELLKQMDEPLKSKLEIINEAKKKVAVLQKEKLEAKKKDRYVIKETFTSSVEYEVYASSEDRAMSLYEVGEYKECNVEGNDRYDYKFESIKKNPERKTNDY